MFLGVAAVLAFMSVIPFFLGEYHIEILILFLINLILAVSYRLMTTNGDWSLAHIVFMGTGAYTTALLAKLLGWPFWATLPLAGVAAAVLGLNYPSGTWYKSAYALLQQQGLTPEAVKGNWLSDSAKG